MAAGEFLYNKTDLLELASDETGDFGSLSVAIRPSDMELLSSYSDRLN